MGVVLPDGVEIEREQDQHFAVFGENWQIVTVFLALQTQWRAIAGAASVVRTGIEYTAIRPVLQLLAIPPRRHSKIFAGLRIMEGAALKYWAEQITKNG